MRRKTLVTIILMAALAAGGGAIYWLLAPGKENAAVATSPPEVPVVAQTVKSSDVPIYLTGIGTVVAYNIDQIRSQITGQIISINFTEGQSVKKGDLLAQIYPAPYQAQLDQYTANRDRDQAQLKNAEANLGRYTPLEKRGFASSQLVDTQQAQIDQLKAAIKADEALMASANVLLGYTRLTSPIDGITGIRLIDIGNIIHPTDVNGVVVVTQIEPISVYFTLPEEDLPKVQQSLAKGPVTVLAYSQDNKVELGKGTLLLIDNQIDQTTGTLKLKANFPNESHRLWPGQLVNARLLADTRKDALTVAASAIQQGPNGAYAYVIKPGNIAQIESVKVAQVREGQALIDSGLTANDEVVVDGQYRLQPGDHVTILQGKAAEEAAAQSAQQMQIP